MNWKKIGILIADIVLGVYLVLAITAFNRPDEQDAVCREVKINITDGAGNGFLNTNEVKRQLQHAKVYPLGDRMSDVCTRQIEETLLKSPLVEEVECYKTQTGRVYINLKQRIAVMRIMANNGESYYISIRVLSFLAKTTRPIWSWLQVTSNINMHRPRSNSSACYYSTIHSGAARLSNSTYCQMVPLK